MKTINFYSFEQQDEFIVNLFKLKKQGFFLDIACQNPIQGNNTYTLEKEFDWNGLCFDIDDTHTKLGYVTADGQIHKPRWEEVRNSPFIQMDATSDLFKNFLVDRIPKDLVVDYISLDVDTPTGQNLALDVLHKIIEAGVRFKAMTFEHEVYKHTIQQSSREILENQGYRRLFSNVRLWGGGIYPDEGAFFEDWWIDPRYFDPNILDIASTGQYFFDCAEAMKTYAKSEYQPHRHCSVAHAREVDIYSTYGHHGIEMHETKKPGWKSAWE